MSNLLGSVLRSHSFIPERILRLLARRSLANFEVYLCLHRVRFSSLVNSGLSDTEIAASELDRLLTLLGCTAPGLPLPRITASFDDGYADAIEYVKTRHATFPGVNWVFFVCPSKTRDRVGFRWDLENHRELSDGSVEAENHRADLKALADQPRCKLATVEQLREVSALARVRLGNHTNCHFALAALNAENAAREIGESRRDFEALFGRTDLFAFPFGVANMHFGPEHVEMLKAEGYRWLYSVEPRPVKAEAREQLEVIPRFAVMGTWPSSKTALYISLVALRESLKNRTAPTSE